MTSFIEPTSRMKIWTVVIHPVVINIRPSIEMDLDPIWFRFHHSCHTNKNRISFVDNFKLHADFKSMSRMLCHDSNTSHKVHLVAETQQPSSNKSHAQPKSQCQLCRVAYALALA